ncbi:MAG: hypothetical protein E4G94_03300, partial [ANME-2 cluster archaeon]
MVITSDYPPSGYNTSNSTTFVLNQSFEGVATGDYIVTNTAQVVGSNPPITSSNQMAVRVISYGGESSILPLGCAPGGVQVGVNTAVTF